MVGEAVGAFVGDTVGDTVGDAAVAPVGASVGLVVGLVVGFLVGVLVGVSVGAHEKAQPDGCALRLGHMQKFWLVEGVAGMTFDSTAKAKLSSRFSPIAVNACCRFARNDARCSSSDLSVTMSMATRMVFWVLA